MRRRRGQAGRRRTRRGGSKKNRSRGKKTITISRGGIRL